MEGPEVDIDRLEVRKGKKRNGNWSKFETDTLKELCVKYSSVLNAAFGSNVTAKRKNELWTEITHKINRDNREMLTDTGEPGVLVPQRTIDQVKKWKNLKNNAVSSVKQYSNYCKGTGKSENYTYHYA